MTWTAQYHHVTQWEDWHDGWGLREHNNCGEAALARFLREAGFPFAGSDHALIAWLRLRLTGQGESENEGYTSCAQITAFLDSLGLDGNWTQDFSQVNSYGGTVLLLTRAQRLAPAQYPASFVGTDAICHYILRLPSGQFNDSMAYLNGQRDCGYTPDSVISALQGSWVNYLPDPHTLLWNGARFVPRPAPTQQVLGFHATNPAPTTTESARKFLVLCDMQARHSPKVDDLVKPAQMVHKGATLDTTGQERDGWAEVVAGGRRVWLWLPNLRQVA